MFSAQVHRNLYLFGLYALAFGMVMGTIPTSVPEAILAGNWLLESNFAEKWKRLKTNALFWLSFAFYFLLTVSLLYSQHITAGLSDLRIKLPLIVLPLILFSSAPITRSEFRNAALAFIAGCVINVSWCFTYSFFLHPGEPIRNASRFMSHIRLGLFLDMGIVLCVFLFRKTSPLKLKTGLSLAGLWLLISLFVLGLLSGLIILLTVALFALIVLMWKKPIAVKAVLICLLAVSVAIIGSEISAFSGPQLKPAKSANNKMLQYTPNYQMYLHFDSIGPVENGNLVQINIQTAELKKQWNKKFPADSFNYSGHNSIRYATLVRYLASRGFTKDSAGLSRLSATDEANILRNLPNYKLSEWGPLRKRIYEAVKEYDYLVRHRNAGDGYVNGHSLTMRIYFWRAALKAIKKCWLAGAGVGDVQLEMDKAYEEIHSPLSGHWRKRPHNQFLTISLMLGIPGLALFLLLVFYPSFQRGSSKGLIAAFTLIAFLSFLTEDTLETQAGATFFAFFLSFLSASRDPMTE
jgi:O-antigen ligase